MNIADQHYPVYIDPTPEDYEALAAAHWDTIRILVADDLKQGFRICVASGYGHTHTSMVSWLKAHFKTKRMWTTASILFYEGDQAYINACDMGGPDKMKAGRALRKYFNVEEAAVLRRIAEDLNKVVD